MGGRQFPKKRRHKDKPVVVNDPPLDEKAAIVPAPNSADAKPTIGKQIWSWPVVGAAVAFAGTAALTFTTTGHPILADAWYLVAGLLLIAKSISWDEARLEAPKSRNLIVGVMVGLAVLVVGGAILGNHHLNPAPSSAGIRDHPQPVPQAVPVPNTPDVTKTEPNVTAEPNKEAERHQENKRGPDALEGDLRGAGLTFNDGRARMTPWVQIADTGPTFIMVPSKPGEPTPPYFNPFPDSEFRTEFGKKGPLVSTTVRDSEGHIVAIIDKNAFEVLDSSLHVVLQLRILKDRVQVQGEWWDNQGHGLRMVKPLKPTKEVGALVMPLGPGNKKNDSLIKPIFKYPSKHHWHEFVGARQESEGPQPEKTSVQATVRSHRMVRDPARSPSAENRSPDHSVSNWASSARENKEFLRSPFFKG
jgi:hypothetical protein